MAIKPLEQRLESILPAADQITSDPMAPVEPMPGEAIETPQMELLSGEPGTPSMEDTTQVAGLFDRIVRGGIGSVTRKAPKAERQLVPEVKPGVLPEPEKVGRFKVIPEADEQLTEEVGRAVSRRQTFGITQGKPPEEAFNLSRFQTEGAAGVVGGVADALGIKTKAVTFDELKAKAKESGISEAFLSRLMAADGKMLPSAVETYQALEVLESSANELDRLFKLVNEGQATDAQKLQLRQQVAFHGLVQKGVKGIQTETARALAVFRIPREGNADIIRQVLDEYGGDRSLQDMARSYLTLDSRAARNQMVEKSMFSSLKDVWFTTYINGLLASFTSHAKNMLGNSMFGLYQIPERLMAGLYSQYLPKAAREGAVPKWLGGSSVWGDLVPGSADEKIALDEALTMIQSLRNGTSEGLQLASTAFRTNQASDLASKVELQRMPQESMGETLQRITGVGQDTWMGKAMDYYGTAVTLPGRALMSEDEFFKGVFYRMHLNTLIDRRGKSIYRQAIEGGASESDALARQQAEMTSLFENPPRDLDDAAMEFARRGTFTGELPPALAALQKVFNHPALKIAVPFFKTPANIGLEVIERTPFAPLSSRFRDDIGKGGVYRDMALAKVTLGSTLLTTFALMAGEGTITGGGPKRPAQRQAWERTGAKPYSFKIGDDYYSYQGLEPIGAFIGMAADYAEYALEEPDAGKVEQVAMGMVYGFYEYMKEQPYLQGLAEITKALGLGRGSGEVDGAKVVNELTKQLGQFVIGGSPLPGTSALGGAIERLLDPNATNVNADPSLPMGLRGLVTAWNRYRSRLPYFNSELPEDLNLWGDPKMQANENLTMRILGMVLPTRVSPDQFSDVDDELVRLGSPIGMPETKVGFQIGQGEGAISGNVELNANQRHRLLTIYGKETNAKDDILRLIRTPGFDLLSKADQQQQVQRLHSKYMNIAKMQLMSEDPGIEAKIIELNELRQAHGNYYKP
jgi:hypothetical protein